VTDSEKVISDVISAFDEWENNTCCPGDDWSDVHQSRDMVIALLKAQEPQGTPEAEWLLYKGMRGATCSYCKHTFDDVYDVENYDYYCRHCGAKMIRMRTVKWE
jgi:Zn finger protein HypA/HybF involved in hydrogenase expression